MSRASFSPPCLPRPWSFSKLRRPLMRDFPFGPPLRCSGPSTLNSILVRGDRIFPLVQTDPFSPPKEEDFSHPFFPFLFFKGALHSSLSPFRLETPSRLAFPSTREWQKKRNQVPLREINFPPRFWAGTPLHFFVSSLENS